MSSWNGLEETKFNFDAFEKLYDEGKYQELIEVANDLETRSDYLQLSIDERIDYTYYLIRSLIILGQYDEALQKITTARPNLTTPQERSLLLALISAHIDVLNRMGQFDEALNLSEEGDAIMANLSLEDNVIHAKWSSRYVNSKGGTYLLKGAFDKALEYFNQALALQKVIKDELEKATILQNIGHTYLRKGDLDTTIEYYERTLSLAEESTNKHFLNRILAGIGNVHFFRGELEKAEEYFQRNFTLATEIGNKQEIGFALNNLGNIYGLKGMLNEALEYQNKTLSLFEDYGNLKDISLALNNIGYTYQQRGELDRALDYYERSLEIKKEIGDKFLIITTVQNLGNICYMKGSLDDALSYYQQGLIMSKEIGNELQASSIYFDLIRLSLDLGDQLQTNNYLNELKKLKEQTKNRIINISYQFAKALILRERNLLQEAQTLLEQIIHQESIDYGIILLARVTVCQILFEKFVLFGRKTIIDDLNTHLEFSLMLAEKKHFNGIRLAILILQGKLASLQSDYKDAQLILQNTQEEADTRGFESLKSQSQEELAKLLEYKLLSDVLSKQEINHPQFQKEQLRDIRNYLEIIIKQVQSEI
ncbi:MAG: tetratricopeptide repeat protein [Candidatus Hermodarchaeota archaeon]